MKRRFVYILLAFLAASCENNKKDPEPALPGVQQLYPVEITRTASYTPDTTVSKFTYSQNRISREDIYVNGKLNGYLVYSYNGGKQTKKVVYDAAGTALEQDEITYNIRDLPTQMIHSHIEPSGNPKVHHYRNYTFGTNKKLSEISDFTPQFERYYKIAYTLDSETFYKFTEYGVNDQFMNQTEIETDGKINPFYAANLDVVHFPGNEVSRTYKDQSGIVTYSVKSSIEYNPEGYPLKITRNHSDGIVKTESYIYMQ